MFIYDVIYHNNAVDKSENINKHNIAFWYNLYSVSLAS